MKLLRLLLRHYYGMREAEYVRYRDWLRNGYQMNAIEEAEARCVLARIQGKDSANV